MEDKDNNALNDANVALVSEQSKIIEMDINNDADIEMEERSRLPTVEDDDDQDNQTSASSTTMTTFAVYKNLVVYSISFVLLFSAAFSFSNLQSTLNVEEGLGTTGLSVIYIAMFVTSLCVTVFTLPLFSYKIMTMISMTTYIVYVASGFYPSWYTVIPASIIIGFGASHLWCTQQAFVTQLGKLHAFNRHSKPADSYGLSL